jgi:molybdopterin-binding protein
MKISARNSLAGVIKSVTDGAVNTEVVIEIAPGIDVVSVITKASAQRLGLKVGSRAFAVVKASDVMIGVE